MDTFGLLGFIFGLTGASFGIMSWEKLNKMQKDIDRLKETIKKFGGDVD